MAQQKKFDPKKLGSYHTLLQQDEKKRRDEEMLRRFMANAREPEKQEGFLDNARDIGQYVVSKDYWDKVGQTGKGIAQGFAETYEPVGERLEAK